MLAYYTEQFDTVELNNSFYHLPKKSSLESWRDSTPAAFCFAAKGSRFLTHMKKLKDPEQGLNRFLDAIEVLEQKLGPILFQLPPNWELDLERLANFVSFLPNGHRYAFEFRNLSWSVPETYDLLARHNNRVLHIPSRRNPFAHRSYGRFHLCAFARTGRKVSGELQQGRPGRMGGAHLELAARAEGDLCIFRQRSSGLRGGECSEPEGFDRPARRSLRLKQLTDLDRC